MIQMEMKFFVLSAMALSVVFSSPVRHEIVLEGGETISGRVEGITDDSLYFQPEGQPSQVTFLLEDVLYSHDGEGRLFHMSDRLKDFVQKGVGRGGSITTIDSQVIPYVNLEDELFMHSPVLAYYASDSGVKKRVELWNIHKVVIDHSLSKYAVQKGLYAGFGLALLSFLLKFDSPKQLLNFNRLSTGAVDVYPNAVTFIPLITIGWVVYDFLEGERELVINPLLSGTP